MRCKDTWKKHIPDEKLTAYKRLLDMGVISNPHVVYSRADKTTIVEYDTEFDQETIRKMLKDQTRKE